LSNTLHQLNKHVVAGETRAHFRQDELPASHTNGMTNAYVARVAISMDDRLLRRLENLVAREVFRSPSAPP
jgi:hypothetical protein